MADPAKCPCGETVLPHGGAGRPGRYCSAACKQRAYRHRRTFPEQMRSRRAWVRRARVWRNGRWHAGAPLTIDGLAASSTDPNTWASFTAASRSRAGVGLGIMLGGGVGCYDLDEVSDAEARAFIATIPEPIIYAERSQSGRGVHLFIAAPEAPGWKRTVLGVNVERYTRERYIAVTGNTFVI